MRSSLFGVLLMCSVLEAQAGGQARIGIRVVNSAKVAPQKLEHAQKRAGYVLRKAGVEVVWQDCSAGEVGGCARRLDRSEFWLHVANWKPEKRSAEMLGFTSLGEDSASSTDVAGVYYPMVCQVALNLQVEEGDVLGAALAHEIGHLLRAGHAPTGVMRERFNRQSIVDFSQGGLLFAKNQAAQIRDAAALRNLAEFPRTDSVRAGR